MHHVANVTDDTREALENYEDRLQSVSGKVDVIVS